VAGGRKGRKGREVEKGSEEERNRSRRTRGGRVEDGLERKGRGITKETGQWEGSR
jgi:hypothetical protein